MQLLKVLMISLTIPLIALSAVSAQDENTDLPDPDPGMTQLDWFLGEWEIVSRYYISDEERWLEENLTANHTAELNGHIILENFVGPFFEEPFEAWSIRHYNEQTELWEQRWIDTSGGAFSDWTGYWDDEAGEFYGFANRGLAEPNQFEELNDRAARETFFNISEDSFSWKYELTEDGGETWNEVWTLEYTRPE